MEDVLDIDYSDVGSVSSLGSLRYKVDELKLDLSDESECSGSVSSQGSLIQKVDGLKLEETSMQVIIEEEEEEDEEDDKINVLLNETSVFNDQIEDEDVGNEFKNLQKKSLFVKSSDIIIKWNNKYVAISGNTILSDALRKHLWPTNRPCKDDLINLSFINVTDISPRMYFAAQYVQVFGSRHFICFSALCVTEDHKLILLKTIDDILDNIPKYNDIYMIRNEHIDTFLLWFQNPFGSLLERAISHSFDSNMNTSTFCKFANTACAPCTCLKMLIYDTNLSKNKTIDIQNDDEYNVLLYSYLQDTITMRPVDFSIACRGGILPINSIVSISPQFFELLWANINIGRGRIVNWGNNWNYEKPFLAIGIDLAGTVINGIGVILYTKKNINMATNVSTIRVFLEEYPDIDIYYSIGRIQKKFMDWLGNHIPKFARARQLYLKQVNIGGFCTGSAELSKAFIVMVSLLSNPTAQSFSNAVYDDPKPRKFKKRFRAPIGRNVNGLKLNHNNRMSPY